VFLIGAGLLGSLPIIAKAQAEEIAQPTNPALNGFASFIIPGLGQYLNDEYGKAWVHFVVAIVIQVSPLHIHYTPPWAENFRIDLLAFGWAVYSAIDAYQTARKFNEEHGVALYLEGNELGISYNY
jgi:hypothetical protein